MSEAVRFSLVIGLLLACWTIRAAESGPRGRAPSPSCTNLQSAEKRVAVIVNSKGTGFLGFATGVDGRLCVSGSANGDTWGEWQSVNSTIGFRSNPVACYQIGTSFIQVFLQGVDGQVYVYQQTGSTSFKLLKLSSDIPSSPTQAASGYDSVQCIVLKSMLHVFARSQVTESRLYYSYGNGTDWSKWVAIGDDSAHLAYDATVAINTFVDRLEVFGVFLSGDLRHTWQTSDTSFEDEWHTIGLFQTEFTSAPVAHRMGPSFFNGNVEVFARATDGIMYRTRQTTCDKVKNPWGPCTWDLYYTKLGGTIPANSSLPNALSIINNIHLGIEIFAVGATDKRLYHIWQAERDGSWSDWEDMGGLTSKSGFESQPFVSMDEHGWWQAFALNKSGGVSRFVQTPLNFTLSAPTVAFDRNVTVTWAIPKDEATHQDWIGVYPSGAESHKYVDYAYVGGTQNPRKDPVPVGKLNFTAVVPNGKYDYRYMVNKEYDTVLQSSLTVYNATKDLEWVQVYRGIARGLGSINVNITLCVEDGNKTVDTFRDAFAAFENREIFDGLHLFAEGLEDLRDALIQCNETVIIKDLTKFIEDLIACTADNCAKFVIDIGIEIVILYEHIYEIFGDIRGATNSFAFDAYEQGGICIGRVTKGCLTAE